MTDGEKVTSAVLPPDREEESMVYPFALQRAVISDLPAETSEWPFTLQCATTFTLR